MGAQEHYKRGIDHQDAGRIAEAEASYRQSLALDAGQSKAYNNLGCVLQMQGRLDEAIAAFKRALEIDPSLAQAQQNLGALIGGRELLEQAVDGYRRQADADPGNALLCHDLGNAYRELGRLKDAVEAFDEAIRRDPQCAQAHWARALALLHMGRWKEAWPDAEWRFRVKGLGPRDRGFAKPLWDGSNLEGTLLLHAEQGLGDSLLFARYAALAARRCRTLIVECQKPLVRLFGSLEGPAKVVPWDEPLPAFDAHLPFMSLPGIFGTTPETAPWSGPYLQAPPQKSRDWSVLRVPGLRQVGIVWSGQVGQGDNRKRSLTLNALAPLAAVDGIRFISLQKDEPARELAKPPAGMHIIDCGPQLTDFADTAAAIANLDLVISVDTSVANLAGAMGIPVWVLVRRDPDWRWLGEPGKTPWYPTARVFRQEQEGAWEPVVQRVAAELASLA